jgi:pyrroline-5-carboxylate reductase
MRIAFIGGGVMGEAIIGSLLAKGVASAGDIAVSDIASSRLDYLSERYGVSVHNGDNAAAVNGRDMALLSIKPQDFASVSNALGPLLRDQTVISIMPGVTLAALQQKLGHRSVVRVMPNTPAQIGEGMSVWTASGDVAPERREEVRCILAALGKEIYVNDEKLIDMATALSGSGPAFVFLMLEALVDAGVHIGLRRDVAAELAMQTVIGSARFAEESGKHLAELKNMVTSPGGTTTEGLLALEEAGVRAAIINAVTLAYDKAKQLGG